MNLTNTVVSGQVCSKPAKKTRRYVVAFQCSKCKRNGFTDNFDDEKSVVCSCGQKVCVSLTEGELPDWIQ